MAFCREMWLTAHCGRYRKGLVVKVKAGSPAARCGVQVGAAVVSVNNRNAVGMDGKVWSR